MNFDELLTADKHEAGAEMQVIHPETGVLTDVYIHIKGVDSKTFRNASLEFNRKKIERVSSEDDLSLDLTVKITVGWRGLDKEFTPELARKLYTDSPAIRAQVDNFFTKRRNFMKG